MEIVFAARSRLLGEIYEQNYAKKINNNEWVTASSDAVTVVVVFARQNNKMNLLLIEMRKCC